MEAKLACPWLILGWEATKNHLELLQVMANRLCPSLTVKTTVVTINQPLFDGTFYHHQHTGGETIYLNIFICDSITDSVPEATVKVSCTCLLHVPMDCFV